ncbi:hypothetical protein BDFB_010067 [Asbolus verrucosus]|uniref:Uncharacterized protein n=1 Tax=Asbolus verrucosus TaxID=1661398 RepID=A0A482W4Q0_ASBVE|nr:hypothetical protein BDFB_010067 [Asbolus verrucosus]
MWSCDRGSLKSSGPIVHVLNGDYPEADVKRMSLNGLERLVAKLVQCTAEAVGAKGTNKPKWWPNGLVFNHLIDLGLEDEREVKLALKQLIVNCSQFFRERTEWNDENRKGRKRPRTERVGAAKRYRAFVQLPPKAFEPFLPMEERREPATAGAPTKDQFLRYFRLNSKRCKMGQAVRPAVHVAAAKITNCTHIPFSSDVGRIMAAREHHHMPEELKLKRLERSEWYTNKAAPRAGEVEYETCVYREPNHTHTYKIPKRQQYQKGHSFHNPEFLARFCTPLFVKLVRLDLEKVKSERDEVKKRLVVMIGNTEKLCCDVKNERILRTSPRLRNV